MTSKKNWTLRAAVLMLALVLITSCFVGGTFAKYVTSGAAADHARVAKWGVTVTAHGTGDVFAEKYDAIDGQPDTVIAAGNGKYKVIAPGTKKENATLVTLSGQPEVAVNVTYSADFSLTGKWASDDKGTFYCPLIITVGDTVIKCAEKNNVDEVKNAVQKAVADCSARYEAKTDLSTLANGGLKISWEWPFEGGETNQKQNDEKDTYLGDQAAKTSDLDVPSIYITVTATVTQID